MYLSQAERQLLVAAWDRRKGKPRRCSTDDLVAFANDIFKGETVDLASAFASLERRGWLVPDVSQGTWALAGDGVDHARVLAREQRRSYFDDWLIRSEKSAAYAEYCRQVYRIPLIQFNSMDAEQYDALLSLPALARGGRVLDLGCGVGTVTEYLSDRSGAHLTGVDFSDRAIQRAAQRCAGKTDRLSFLVGDLNDADLPPGPFDAVVAIDTLYFVTDLGKLIEKILHRLVPGGEVAFFYTTIRRDEDGPDILEADSTPVARALLENGVARAPSTGGWRFESLEFTSNERRIWEACRLAVNDLKSRFEAEGNLDLWESRERETAELLAFYGSGSARRYFYRLKSGPPPADR